MSASDTVPNTSEIPLNKTTVNSNSEDPSRNSAVVTAAAHWKNNRLQSISLPPNTNLLKNEVLKEEPTSETFDHQQSNSRSSLITGGLNPGNINNNGQVENGPKMSANSDVIKYQLQATNSFGQAMPTQTVDVDKNMNQRVGDSLLFTIPYMDIKLAYVCLILNIFIPGLGTLLSGFSLLCLSSSTPQDDRKQEEVIQLCCSNLCVGLSQMFTITFFLVGWIWSITWGVNMVILANHQQKIRKANRHHKTTISVAQAFMGM